MADGILEDPEMSQVVHFFLCLLLFVREPHCSLSGCPHFSNTALSCLLSIVGRQILSSLLFVCCCVVALGAGGEGGGGVKLFPSSSLESS